MAVQPFPSPHMLQLDDCPTFNGVTLFGSCTWLRSNNLKMNILYQSQNLNLTHTIGINFLYLRFLATKSAEGHIQEIVSKKQRHAQTQLASLLEWQA